MESYKYDSYSFDDGWYFPIGCVCGVFNMVLFGLEGMDMKVKEHFGEKLTIGEWLMGLSENYYVDMIENEVCILPIKED